MTMMLAISTNLMLAVRKASFQGFLVISPLALISWKIGVSCSCRRIQMAIATKRKESRNGMRQAQASNVALPK